DVRLTSVRLTEDSPIVGKTVVTSRIREDYEALLVAIQRDNIYHQPEPSIEFAPDDVLWLVGDVHRLRTLSGNDA
ncbi:MAG: TrkA C-terminal domain-containing protein, partial [Duncaniella sp.]|nr:TrkA C-terminal domain-containing protein [Duncaniella sp.]